MKYLSLFTGIGGFELGIQQAYELQKMGDKSQNSTDSKSGTSQHSQRSLCIGYSEIDKYAIQIYDKRFKHENRGDITKITAEHLPDFDLVVGGFPCQSFSIAGKRGGFDDTRGTLFFDIARIAKAKEPMFLLLENVKGLISHDEGRTLEVILETLQELGYYVNIEVRNSKDYGVPQNRERIFFTCTHIKGFASVGQNEKMTFSERIIQQWLFQLLLNNLKEVTRLQEHNSKDWVVAWLICREINRNQNQNGKNIWDGITTPMGGGLFRSKEGEVWQNIVTWLSKELGEDLNEQNKSTISTAIKQIIESKTYTYAKMFQATLLATVLLRNSSKNLWNEILSSLILIQEDTNYERINNRTKQIIITESGTAHSTGELQDFSRYFLIGHLRGTSRPKVFPFGEGNSKNLKQIIGGGQRNRVYGTEGISTTIASQAGGQGAKTGLYAIDPYNKKEIDGRVSTALRTNYHNGNIWVKPDTKIRRLTPTECERLQGFPDNWTEGGIDKDGKEVKISDSQRYKVLGNAVTINVIQAIAERLL